MSETLTPIEQKTVLFYDDEITAVRLEDGRIVIPVRPLCERLGVQWSAQSKRINRDPVLADERISVSVMDTQGQQRRNMVCLPLDMLNGWLFGINATRVKDEVRDHLIRYQRECYRVLYEATQEGRLSPSTASPTIDDLLKMGGDAADAYRMAMAVAKLARHQLMLEVQQLTHGKRLDEHDTRLEELENALLPGTAVTADQAMQISQAVKAVAIEQGKQTKRNEFGAVYGELYRKFGITSYKLLPVAKFEEAMAWLSEWHQSLTGDAF